MSPNHSPFLDPCGPVLVPEPTLTALTDTRHTAKTATIDAQKHRGDHISAEKLNFLSLRTRSLVLTDSLLHCWPNFYARQLPRPENVARTYKTLLCHHYFALNSAICAKVRHLVKRRRTVLIVTVKVVGEEIDGVDPE